MGVNALLHVKQVSRYFYHATFCIMILVSLHTKSSSMFHAEFVYKLFPPNWRILTMKTLSCKLFLWPNTITTFFPFPAMVYFRCQTSNSTNQSQEQKKKFLSLCCIVTNTEWNGIIKLIIEVKCIRIILSPNLIDLIVF